MSAGEGSCRTSSGRCSSASPPMHWPGRDTQGAREGLPDSTPAFEPILKQAHERRHASDVIAPLSHRSYSYPAINNRAPWDETTVHTDTHATRTPRTRSHAHAARTCTPHCTSSVHSTRLCNSVQCVGSSGLRFTVRGDRHRVHGMPWGGPSTDADCGRERRAGEQLGPASERRCVVLRWLPSTMVLYARHSRVVSCVWSAPCGAVLRHCEFVQDWAS